MEDKLYPVIHSSDWPFASDYFHRHLLQDDDDSPLIVTYATNPDSPETCLTKEAIEALDTPLEELEQAALENWTSAHGDFSWRTQSIANGPEDALIIQGGDYTTSSVLLSHGHLKGIHQHFDEEHIGIITPSRGTVIAHPDFLLLASLARHMYEESKSRHRELIPICFASYDAHVLGYVTPDYERENVEGDFLSEEEQIDLAIKVLDNSLVMVGSDGPSSAQHLEPYAEKNESIAEKACKKLLDENLSSTAEHAKEDFSQLRLLTFLSQSIYNFDKASPNVDQYCLRVVVKEIATIVAEQSGGGTFRMDSEAGKHEQSSLEVLMGVLK